jgi:hypothetical protein
MSRMSELDQFLVDLERLIADAKKPARNALIARLRGHQYKYAMEDGELYRDLVEAVEMLKGGSDA